MNKIKFGTREVIAAIVSIAIYIIVDCIQRYAVQIGLMAEHSYHFFKLRVLVVTVSAALFGPFVGVIVAIAGAVIITVMFSGNVIIVEMLAYAINGLFIGYYSDKFGVMEGEFKRIKILDYNVVQFIANSFCSAIFSPLLMFVVYNEELMLSLKKGVESCIGNVIGSGILGTAILVIISKYNSVKLSKLES